MDSSQLTSALKMAIREAETTLPSDVVNALAEVRKAVGNAPALAQMQCISENVAIAHDRKLPICQDTGIVSFYISAGTDNPHLNEIVRVIGDILPSSTHEVPLRPNTVHPFTGLNPGDNTGPYMPVVDVMFVPGDETHIHILPKGGGSENWSALWMNTPSIGLSDIKTRVAEHLVKAGGKPCPPLILGIGIGGTADMAMRLAKRALLRPIGSRHPEENISHLEEEIKNTANKLGIGPMGLGGDGTVMDVHIEYTYRHPATFPIALAVQCWADRRATVVVRGDGTVEVVP